MDGVTVSTRYKACVALATTALLCQCFEL